jgi:hypothetical protein
MMNCMGSGGGASLVGGIRVADWALGLTYGAMLLVAVLLIASSARAVLQNLRTARERTGDEREFSRPSRKGLDGLRTFFISSKTSGGLLRRPNWKNLHPAFSQEGAVNERLDAIRQGASRLLDRRPNELLGVPADRFAWLPQSRFNELPAAIGQKLLAASKAVSSMIALAITNLQNDHGQFIHGLSHNGREVRAAVFNENEVRAAAGLTMALGAAAFVYAFFARVYLPIQVVTTMFVFEFLIRVTFGLRYSPMGMLAHWLTRGQPPQWVSAKPKRFAWTLGLSLSLAMMVITNSGIRGALPLTICLICLTLMWLEAVLGLCLGCQIHGLMVRRGWITRNDDFEICAHDACATENTSPIGQAQ